MKKREHLNKMNKNVKKRKKERTTKCMNKNCQKERKKIILSQ